MHIWTPFLFPPLLITASEGTKQEAEDGSLAFGLTPADAGDAASLPGGGGGGKAAFVEATGASGMDERSSNGEEWTSVRVKAKGLLGFHVGGR